MSKEQYSAAFMLIAKLAAALGVQSLKDTPGVWVHKVDDNWLIRLNAHPEDVDGIPPYNALVEFQGWPWGVISPFNGSLMNGVAGATEDTFCDALLAAIIKAHGGNQL